MRAGESTSVTAPDGKVRVEIPGAALEGDGTLRIEAISNSAGGQGWLIELEGTQLTGTATIRFATTPLLPGEPMPLVSYETASRGGERLIADGVAVEGSEIVVRTTHFSNWFVDRWNELLEWVKRDLVERMDAAMSISKDRAPKGDGEREARAAGYAVTSDSGNRVYWCFGLQGGKPILKVVNARGFGVAVERSPGVTVTYRDADDALGIIAKLVTLAPSEAGNRVELLASGNRAEFGFAGAATTVGVRISPDPGGYLLSALQYGLSTYLTIVGKIPGAGDLKSADRLAAALQGSQCLSSFTSMATTSLDTAQQVTQFFSQALAMSFDCIALGAKELVAGPVGLVVEGVMWILSGLKTASDGIVAALDTAFDFDGYQIVVSSSGSAAPDIVKAGVCGADAFETGRVDFQHLTWGRSTLLTCETKPQARVGAAVFDSRGTLKWKMSREGYVFKVASPGTDASKNLFIMYNPGRYDGVEVLAPVPDGIETYYGWDMPIEDRQRTGGIPETDPLHLSGYYANLLGPGADGLYRIEQFNNDCTPSCAEGTTTSRVYVWNGSDYEPAQ